MAIVAAGRLLTQTPLTTQVTGLGSTAAQVVALLIEERFRVSVEKFEPGVI